MHNQGRTPNSDKLIGANIQTLMLCPFFIKAGVHFTNFRYEHWPSGSKFDEPHPSKTSPFGHRVGLLISLWIRLLFSRTFASAEKVWSFGKKKSKKSYICQKFMARVLTSEVWHIEGDQLSPFTGTDAVSWTFHAKTSKVLDKLGLDTG